MVRAFLAFGLLALFSTSACVGESIVDDISTELTITEPGSPGTRLEIRKRFRFSHDPALARGVYFEEARLQVIEPFDVDLSVIHRVEVFAIHPVDGPVLVAVGDGFEPGENFALAEIVYEEDLREFAGDDSRITFSFFLEASAWARPFPAEGVTLLAAASIGIDI